jgi:hypothetical protein
MLVTFWSYHAYLINHGVHRHCHDELTSTYQINTDKCTHVLLIHHFVNILCNLKMFEPLKGHLQRILLIHSSSKCQQNESPVVKFNLVFSVYCVNDTLLYVEVCLLLMLLLQSCMVGILECFCYVLIYFDVRNYRTVHVCVLHQQTAWQNQWQNCIHATEFFVWNFWVSVNACGCIQSSFVAVCIGDFEKPVSCDNSLRDCEDASNSFLVQCNVSAERMCECSLLLL